MYILLGSPFEFHVDAISDGYLTAFGPGLAYGTAGEPAAFTVCVREVGAGVFVVLSFYIVCRW